MNTKATQKFVLLFDQVFNVNTLAVCFVIAGLLCLEVRADLFERMMGDYLFWQNTKKGEIGRVWKKKEQKEAASKAVRELVLEKKDQKTETPLPDTMPEFLAALEPEKVRIIEVKKFVRLYNSLPASLTKLLLPREEILSMMAVDGLAWVAFTNRPFHTEVVFYNADVRFLLELSLDDDLFNRIVRYHKRIESPAPFFEEFEDRVYEREEFLSALYELDAEDRLNILTDPTLWLQWIVTLKYVGLSKTTLLDRVEIGFLILEKGDRYSIYRMSVPEMSVFNLSRLLKEREAGRGPVVEVVTDATDEGETDASDMGVTDAHNEEEGAASPEDKTGADHSTEQEEEETGAPLWEPDIEDLE